MVRALVEEILSYLDVDERTEGSIYAGLVPGLEERDVRDFPSVYSAVTNWIDTRRKPYEERFHKEIDNPYSDGERRQYADPNSENPLDILLQCEDGQDPNSWTFGELKKFLEDNLDPEHFQLVDHLFEKNRSKLKGRRYDRNLVQERVESIQNRLEVSSSRYVNGTLLVPQKSVIAVRFLPENIRFVYRSGYPDEVVMRVYELLLEGASLAAASRMTGITVDTIRKWKKDIGEFSSEMSEIYPKISKFAERRLTEAAEIELDVNQASEYSGINKSIVRGFWRRIGHDYLTPEQKQIIMEGIRAGASRFSIQMKAGIGKPDFKYFVDFHGSEAGDVEQNRSVRKIFVMNGSLFFKPRNYNGDPLAFFRKHANIYGRMTRAELQKFDNGLYDALYTRGQIEIAIPESFRGGRLRKDEVRKIVTSLRENDGCINDAAKETGYSFQTVKKYARGKGIKTKNMRGNPLTKDDITKIETAHTEFDGNSCEAARQLNRSPTTILKYWRRSGLID